MLSFVSLFIAGVVGCWGGGLFRQLLFPLGFLIFMVPIPSAATLALETLLQYASAEVASWMFIIAGTPVFRDGLVFELPGITIEVARECSGIRSSLVLFVTSVLAGYLFLKRPAHRWILIALVIPLGILRNAFRVFTIGMLCVHIGPEMIHSVIHHRGGPLFFLMSLVPFFLVLVLMRKMERAGGGQRAESGGQRAG